MKNRIASFRYAFNGLKVAFQEEPNFRVHVFALIAVVGAGLYFDISRWDWIAITLTASIVIITELLNTAIENVCDFIHPDQDLSIGRIKDICAAAVLISTIFAVIIAVFVFRPYL